MLPNPHDGAAVTIEPGGDPAIRLMAVRDEIAPPAPMARRDPASVTLVAVSKTFAAEAIAPVLAAGQRVFGENRVQEAKAKWPAAAQRASRTSSCI